MHGVQLKEIQAAPASRSFRMVVGWFVALALLMTVAFALGQHSRTASWLIAMEHGDVSMR